MQADCPDCQGTGFILETRDGGVVVSTPCACAREDRSRRLLETARIPRRYEHCSFDSFEIHHRSHEPALRRVREWAEGFPVVEQGLLLMGAPGTGKTHLVVALARELALTKGVRVLFFEQRALLKALQGTFESGAAVQESEVLGPVLDAEVLILDDLGAGRTTAWARDVLHDVLAHRYNERKHLIITTNLDLEQESPGAGKSRTGEAPLTLADRLGDALISRLHEMCRMIRLDGADYRKGVRAHRG